MAVVGVRREDKSVWEKRTPLVPDDVARLVKDHGVSLRVQRSEGRCFPDEEFARAGAELVDDLSGASVVLGVKEIPAEILRQGTTYAFFSHTTKGQHYNMPMLRRLLDLRCSLLDYELITDGDGLRTIAFGRHAGLAGAIDTLAALGRRFALRGVDTPLADLHPAVHHGSVESARAEIVEVGRRIAAEGLPPEISPVAIGVTGAGGKVFGGAVEVLEFLPHRYVDPADLAADVGTFRGKAKEVLIVGYGPEHLVEPVRPDVTYGWEHYLENPGEYRAAFGPHLAHLSAVIHGIFWKEGYPRFILREDLAGLWSGSGEPRLELITDVTCDLGGSNEALVRVTDPGDPAYVYDPRTGRATPGWEGDGVAVIAVDILPSEIPVDSSRHFSERLAPLVPALSQGAPDPEDRRIPGELRRGVLVSRGRLVPPWDAELAEPLRRHGNPEAVA